MFRSLRGSRVNIRMPIIAKITLWLGIIFSILIFIQLGASPIVLVISAPFIILMNRLKKNADFQKAFVYALPFLICHILYSWSLKGLSTKPQEFGSVGIILLPVYEGVVAIPLAKLTLYFIGPSNKAD
jgi:hypothetical protein